MEKLRKEDRIKMLGQNLRYVIIILTPILLSPIPGIFSNSIGYTAYCIMIMGVYWCTECLPLAATALLPMALFPLFGILPSKVVCAQYMKDINVLFFSGLMIAIAVEDWNLHKRIALRVLMLFGTKPRWLMLGFMSVTAFLSMWMSNTATTAMMVPIAQAVLLQLKGGPKSQDEKADEGIRESKGETTDYYNDIDERKPIDTEAIIMEDFKKEGKSTDTSAVDPQDQTTTEEDGDESFNLISKAIILCVPYAANIGGTGTLIGTGPNLVLIGQAESLFGTETGINFGTYLLYAFPGMVLCLLFAWGWLQIFYVDRSSLWQMYLKVSKYLHLPYHQRFEDAFNRNRTPAHETNAQSDRAAKYIQKTYDDLGPMSYAEKVVLGHVVLVALLWLTRDPKFVPGWASAFVPGFVTDSTAGMIVAMLLFLIPSKPPQFLCGYRKYKQGRTNEDIVKVPALLEWDVVSKKMAWNVVILLGGGFALAEACKESGLSAWLGDQFLILKDFSPEAMALLISVIVAVFTEITSNTSTASIFLPILAALGTSLEINPLFLMISASIACSFAFMLPVATPPNAIAFAYGHVSVLDMAKTGFILNVGCILISNLSVNTLGVWIFDLKTFPDWAADMSETTTALMNTTSLCI